MTRTTACRAVASEPPDLIDPLLVLLRRHEAANVAFDAAVAADASDEARDRLFAVCSRTADAIVARAPPATTAAGAIAALEFVLEDQVCTAWKVYPHDRFLRQLVIAALDYIKR
jgi:hypothetical protein